MRELDGAIKKWPDFSYVYRLKSLKLYEDDPPNCKEGRTAAIKELSLDPDSPTKERLSLLEMCSNGIANANAVALTFDVDQIVKNAGYSASVQATGHNNILVNRNHRSVALSMKYIGPLHKYSKGADAGIWFRFDITAEGDAGMISLLHIPKQGKVLYDTRTWLDASQFLANNGVASIYVPASDMENLKELMLVTYLP